MQSVKSQTKMVIATLGLEVHWRGAVSVTRMLRDLGIEVIYIGNAFPEEIIQVAIQEDVDIVGVSSLTGGHLILGSELMQLAREKGISERIVFVIGGVFPPADIPKLKDADFDGVIGPGSTGEAIYTLIMDAVASKRSQQLEN
jgi:methylmalonyl-CoA mutase C-terminal domain/subunit